MPGSRKGPLKIEALMAKWETQKFKKESVANHSAVSWAEIKKKVNPCKGKPDDGSGWKARSKRWIVSCEVKQQQPT